MGICCVVHTVLYPVHTLRVFRNLRICYAGFALPGTVGKKGTADGTWFGTTEDEVEVRAGIT